MCRGAMRSVGLLLLVASTLGATALPTRRTPENRLQARLAELTKWLEASHVAAEWRAIFPLDQLDQELKKASDADSGGP